MHEYALHGDATLAGKREPAGDDAGDREREVGSVIDDHAALPPSSRIIFFFPARGSSCPSPPRRTL